MSLRDFILLISIVSFSTSSSLVRPQKLLIVHLLSKPVRSIESIPDRLEEVHPEPKAPQLQIHLIKGYVSPDEKLAFSNEYKYSGKHYDTTVKVTLTTDEKKVSRVENDDMDKRGNERKNGTQDIVMPDKFIPEIGSKNIITAPTFCPAGEKKDSKGRCRTVIE
ncbi:uncharacterized protein [Anoplolepis gracilipes]|uniref:uncharacterized protein n=1 Tax=Anoplolepis gracilipes TaxID=354296 RepID=UPI003BA09398